MQRLMTSGIYHPGEGLRVTDTERHDALQRLMTSGTYRVVFRLDDHVQQLAASQTEDPTPVTLKSILLEILAKHRNDALRDVVKLFRSSNRHESRSSLQPRDERDEMLLKGIGVRFAPLFGSSAIARAQKVTTRSRASHTQQYLNPRALPTISQCMVSQSRYDSLSTTVRQHHGLPTPSLEYRPWLLSPSPIQPMCVPSASSSPPPPLGPPQLPHPPATLSTKSTEPESKPKSTKDRKRKGRQQNDALRPAKQPRSRLHSALTMAQKLACPYYQRNPQGPRIQRSCAGPGWDDMHRVK